MNWEILLEAVGLVVAAVVVASTIATRLSSTRIRLKHDLEVLNLLSSNDPNYEVVRKQVGDTINQVYGSQDVYEFAGLKIHSSSDFGGGLAVLSVGAVWFFYLIQDDWSWWATLPIILLLGGIGGIMTGLEGKQK